MNREEISKTVREIVAKQAHYDEISESTNLRYDLAFDSLDIVDVELKIGATYNIDIDEDKFAEFDTVGEIINYVISKL